MRSRKYIAELIVRENKKTVIDLMKILSKKKLHKKQLKLNPMTFNSNRQSNKAGSQNVFDAHTFSQYSTFHIINM